jgi:hypothetical protein
MPTGKLKSADPRVIRVDAAGRDPNQARSQLLKERENIATLQPPTDNYLAGSINAMDLKERLAISRPIVVTACMFSSSEIVRASTAPTSMALACRWRSRPQHRSPACTYPYTITITKLKNVD